MFQIPGVLWSPKGFDHKATLCVMEAVAGQKTKLNMPQYRDKAEKYLLKMSWQPWHKKKEVPASFVASSLILSYLWYLLTYKSLSLQAMSFGRAKG